MSARDGPFRSSARRIWNSATASPENCSSIRGFVNRRSPVRVRKVAPGRRGVRGRFVARRDESTGGAGPPRGSSRGPSSCGGSARGLRGSSARRAPGSAAQQAEPRRADRRARTRGNRRRRCRDEARQVAPQGGIVPGISCATVPTPAPQGHMSNGRAVVGPSPSVGGSGGRMEPARSVVLTSG